MGGGGGTSPGYEDFHIEAHGAILTGQVVNEDQSGFDPLASDVGGIFGIYGAARISAIGQSPYGATVPFSPSDSNSRFSELLDEIDEYVDSIDGSEPSVKYNDNFDLIEAQVDALWDTEATDDLADEVEEFKKKRQTDFYEELGTLQAGLSSINAMGNTQAGVSAGLLMRRYGREVGDYREKLKLEHHSFRRRAAIGQALVLAEKQSAFLNTRAQSIGVLSQVTDLWSTAIRQRKEDELRLAIEDIFWDGKLHDFLAKALSSISGASIVPSGSHGENQTLNTISTVAAIGSQAIGLYGNIRDNRNNQPITIDARRADVNLGPNGTKTVDFRPEATTIPTIPNSPDSTFPVLPQFPLPI